MIPASDREKLNTLTHLVCHWFDTKGAGKTTCWYMEDTGTEPPCIIFSVFPTHTTVDNKVEKAFVELLRAIEIPPVKAQRPDTGCAAHFHIPTGDLLAKLDALSARLKAELPADIGNVKVNQWLGR